MNTHGNNLEFWTIHGVLCPGDRKRWWMVFNYVNHKDVALSRPLRTEYRRTKRALVVFPFFNVFKAMLMATKPH